MVHILVGLVHIYSLESIVKIESCRIFARNDIKKINFTNEHAWQSALVGTKFLLRVRGCVVASLFDLSVPKSRAKASKLLNHKAQGGHMWCIPSWETTHWPQIKASGSFLEVVQRYCTLFSSVVSFMIIVISNILKNSTSG